MYKIKWQNPKTKEWFNFPVEDIEGKTIGEVATLFSGKVPVIAKSDSVIFVNSANMKAAATEKHPGYRVMFFQDVQDKDMGFYDVMKGYITRGGEYEKTDS